MRACEAESAVLTAFRGLIPRRLRSSAAKDEAAKDTLRRIRGTDSAVALLPELEVERLVFDLVGSLRSKDGKLFGVCRVRVDRSLRGRRQR